MKRFPSFILSLCFAMLAAGPSPRLKADDFPQAESDLRPDPDVHFGQLANGVNYAILANHAPEDQASLRLVIGAGSFNETDGQQGLAHFLAHLAFRGSAHYPPGALLGVLKRWGMSTDPEDDSQTDFDHTSYMLELPDTRAKTLKEGFQIFADYAGGLLLRDDQIDAERAPILSEKLERGSLAYRDQIAEMKFTLPDTLIPSRLPIGLGDVIEHANRDQFLDFYNAWYRPGKITVVAVGDFDPADVEGMIKDAFGDLKDRAPARPDPKLGDIPIAGGLKIKFLPEPGTEASRISIETVTPYFHEADTAQKRLANLQRSLAFAMLNRRLADRARKDDAPFASGTADVGEQFDFLHNASLQVIPHPAYRWEPALAAGEQELRRALEYGFQPVELDKIVSSMRKGLEQAVNRAAARNSKYLADALVRSLEHKQVFTSPAENLAIYGDALDHITAEDCAAALKDAWAAKGTYLLVAGDIEIPAPEHDIAAAYQASEAVAVEPLPKIMEEKFPYADFGVPGQVESRKDIPDLGITEVVFANGVRLNLKTTKFEPGKVDVSVRVGGGVLTEPAETEPGLARFTEGVFYSAGLGKLSVQDIRRVLAGKIVGFGFSVQDDAFSFTGATDPEDLPLECQLITAYLTDPGYRASALERAHQAIPDMYGSLAETPEGALETKIARVMANGDPRFGVPAESDLMARNLDEMKAWLTPQFAHGPVEVAMVGDFDPAAAIAAVSRTLGALPARDAKPSYAAERAVSFPDRALSQVYQSAPGVTRTAIIMVWPTTDGHDYRISDRLGLLASVFTARMRARFHDQGNGDPLPSARNDSSTTFTGYGTMTIDVSTDAATALDTGKTVLAIADVLQKKGVLDEEAERAKHAALTAIDVAARTNDYWIVSVLAAAQEHPERLEWARKKQDDVNGITAADLSYLATRYLDPARSSTFLISPEPAGP